ncbi:MAG: type II toxin-antitoxin system VapC family toxin [Vicinamibacteria bacterium]
MIVLDASALVELLLGTAAGRAVLERIASPDVSLHAPHLADVEVAQVLRRLARDGDLDPGSAGTALADLRALDLERHSHEPLLERVWALRDNLTAYDAVYVALAEALDAKLVTCDRRLARAPGLSRRVELVG